MRAYERNRETLHAKVIELKRRRRISLASVISVMFENRGTMRHQIQEMARVEKLVTDRAIQDELDIYNTTIPVPGQLCATVFIELTSGEQMREWLSKLVGIEGSLVFRLADASEVRAITEEQHELRLTRDDVTPAVHYVRFESTAQQVASFNGIVMLASDHPSYLEQIELNRSPA